MMTEEEHHEELIRGISDEFRQIFDHSPQAVYLYLDDVHKLCNKRFADLLGYVSADAWKVVEAPLADVVEQDRQAVIDAYMQASEKLAASQLDVRLTNIKSGKVTNTTMIMVPVSFREHIFVLHFLFPK